jgi:hypothetical protein
MRLRRIAGMAEPSPFSRLRIEFSAENKELALA